MFALADCNNFFVSCERLFRPDLNGKPVIVLSNNDGCAVARSNEAKVLGIKMGDPLFKIMPIVKKENVAVFSSNYTLYGDISNRIRDILREFAGEIEVYSIDEAFINLSGMNENGFDKFAKELSKQCLKNVGIPVSVGISHSRTLAKIASKLCKKYPKLNGGCYMHRPEDIEKVLKKFPVDDVWGIGRRSCGKLHSISINTAWDYVSMQEKEISYLFGINGVRTWKELKGISCIDIFQTLDSKQSLSHSRSFAKEIGDITILGEQVANFAAAIAEKLRKQQSLCTEMIVYASTNRFKEDQPQSYLSTLVRFPEPTDSTRFIVSGAMSAIREIYRKDCSYKKAGVIASKIISGHFIQKSLFSPFDTEKESKLMKAVDIINGINGENFIRTAAQGQCKTVSSSKYRSPNYTTNWDEIPTVVIK